MPTELRNSPTLEPTAEYSTDGYDGYQVADYRGNTKTSGTRLTSATVKKAVAVHRDPVIKKSTQVEHPFKEVLNLFGTKLKWFLLVAGIAASIVLLLALFLRFSQ